MEWDNDIDGEIEIFDDNKETTAKFIKIQLKTVDSSEPFDTKSDFFSYDASVKFLNFCDVCDIPIILVVYNISKEEGYFLFVQKYIYETLDFKSPKWRNNQTKIRLHISFENSLVRKESKNEIEKIANNGTDLITQLRKNETANNYYTILNQNDNSHGTALRTSIRILVEKSFAASKEAMRILIPKVNEECKKKIYHSNNILVKHFRRKTYDVIYLFFYDSLQQVNHGLPFCRTLWISEKLPTEHSPFISEPNDYIKNLKRFNKDLDKLNSLFFNFGFPPIECKDLDVKIQSLICLLHNIKLVVNDTNREPSNILACIKMYMKSIDSYIGEYEYERKKVK
jgi:hypothetical protein